MVASQLLVAGRLSHLLTTDDTDVVAPLQIFWCCIWKALIHVGSDTPVQRTTSIIWCDHLLHGHAMTCTPPGN